MLGPYVWTDDAGARRYDGPNARADIRSPRLDEYPLRTSQPSPRIPLPGTSYPRVIKATERIIVLEKELGLPSSIRSGKTASK